MKKLILTIFITMSALPLWAEWELVGGNSKNGYNYYIDFDRVREKGGCVYYWYLANLKEKDEDGAEDGALSYIA